MKITIKSNPKELKKIRLEVKLYCKANFAKIDTSKVIIAVDEALQNVMRYAYDMKIDELIDIFFKKTKSNDFEVKIRDYGKQSPLENIKSRDLKEFRPGGLGVHFIKSSSKEMSYEHQKDGGTLLTLVF